MEILAHLSRSVEKLATVGIKSTIKIAVENMRENLKKKEGEKDAQRSRNGNKACSGH